MNVNVTVLPIRKHCSIHREQKNIGKLLWVAFCDFLEFFLKI
jgi:hypothetical protein